jgi:hypothetical protein
MMEWDRKNMVPVPVNLNPMTTIRDPRATSINGNLRGNGACRFIGWEVTMTEGEMKADPNYKNIKVEDINSMPLPVNNGESFEDRRRTRDEDMGHGENSTTEEKLIGVPFRTDCGCIYEAVRSAKF